MLTKDDEKIIIGLHNKGWGDVDIAAKMGISAKDVELVLREVRHNEAAVEARKP